MTAVETFDRFFVRCKVKTCKRAHAVEFPRSSRVETRYRKPVFYGDRPKPYTVEVISEGMGIDYAMTAACPFCGTGRLRYMGRVHGANIVAVHERCACDGRCTGAKGPNCDCTCQGTNHGTGAVVQVEAVGGSWRAIR